jgi:carboxymethylenebutenolidase
MKRLLSFFFVVLVTLCKAQNNCCLLASTESFSRLGNDRKFVSSHADPLPFTLLSPLGKSISFKTSDGKEGYGYEITSKNTDKVILVIHEWWGLNDYIKQEAEKISKETNARVIALDLYDGKVATNKDSAGKYMQSVTKERAEAIIKGALSYVGPNAKIASIGWCFGGGWSMQTALLAEKQAKACVIYYGMPEENPEKLKTLNAPVFMVYGKKDHWINSDVVSKFEKNMKTAGKKLIVHGYDADHAFANPSNPHYNKTYSEEAFKLAMGFINEHIN